MRKLAFVLAIITLVAGVSVQAQKSAQYRFGNRPIRPQNIVIQDDAGGGFFVVNPENGEYKCVLCEYAYELSGVGEVKIEGCTLSFSHVEKGYRIFAEADLCRRQAKLACEVFELPNVGFDIEPILEYWADTEMKDSTADCPGLKTK